MSDIESWADGLSDYARKTLNLFWYLTANVREMYPSQQWLADRVGIGLRKMKYILNELREMGVIQSLWRGVRRTCLYRVSPWFKTTPGVYKKLAPYFTMFLGDFDPRFGYLPYGALGAAVHSREYIRKNKYINRVEKSIKESVVNGGAKTGVISSDVYILPQSSEVSPRRALVLRRDPSKILVDAVMSGDVGRDDTYFGEILRREMKQVWSYEDSPRSTMPTGVRSRSSALRDSKATKEAQRVEDEVKSLIDVVAKELGLTEHGRMKLSVYPSEVLQDALVEYKKVGAPIYNAYGLFDKLCVRCCEQQGIKPAWSTYFKCCKEHPEYQQAPLVIGSRVGASKQDATKSYTKKIGDISNGSKLSEGTKKQRMVEDKAAKEVSEHDREFFNNLSYELSELIKKVEDPSFKLRPRFIQSCMLARIEEYKESLTSK